MDVTNLPRDVRRADPPGAQMSQFLQFVGAFLASAVEMVEALTIVLAVGITRGWRAALIGVAAALLALTTVVAALGPALVDYVPLEVLQVVIGALLLVFGLQWLRKAILRAAGLVSLRDEDRIFRREVAELRGGPAAAGAFDWTGFTVSFKGVFLEGLEVAFIVLTFGTSEGRFDLSVAGALAAFVLVALTGLAVHRPLSRVPENAIKFGVGLLLSAFGTFWGGEGVGIAWTAGDLMIPAFVLLYGAASWLLVLALRPRAARPALAERQGEA